MTGAYFRVKRQDRWENIEIEHLTDSERSNLLNGRDVEFILSSLNLVCNKLRECEQIFDELVEDGILAKQI